MDNRIELVEVEALKMEAALAKLVANDAQYRHFVEFSARRESELVAARNMLMSSYNNLLEELSEAYSVPVNALKSLYHYDENQRCFVLAEDKDDKPRNTNTADSKPTTDL